MGVLIACSGPGAMVTITRNTLIAFILALFVELVFWASLILWRRSGGHRRIFPALCLILLLFHPAWTVSAGTGDCGFFKRDASIVFAGGAAVLIILQAFLSARTRPRSSGQPVP